MAIAEGLREALANLEEPAEDREAPTAEGVLALLQDYREYYKEFHSRCKEEEDFYFLRFKVPVPTDMAIDEVKPATATAIVNVATDHVDVNNVAINVPAASPRAKARAERLKKFYQGAWLQVPAARKRVAVKQAFLYGVSFFKVMFDPDRWPRAPVEEEFPSSEEYAKALEDFMEARNIAWPLVVLNVNPKNMVWDDSRTGMRWAIEFYERSAGEVRKRYPMWASAAGDKDFVDWIEYWDDSYCGYMAGGQWVWGPHRHGYGFNPMVPILPTNALGYDDGPPHERYMGILRPVHSLLKAEARLVCQLEAIIRTYAWRTLDFYGNTPAAESAAGDYELFGSKNIIPPGVEVKPSPTASPPPELLQQLNVVQTMIEEATFPNVVRGMRPRGVSTGFAISVLAGMGRLVFQGVADAVAFAIAQANSRLALLVQNKVQGKLTVHARSRVHSFDQTIGPEDVRDYTENQVDLKAEAPEERERESLLALRLYQGGIISKYEAQRRAGVVNPLEEQLQQAAERLLASPAVEEAQQRLAAERLGLLGQLAQAAGLSGTAGAGGIEGINVGNQFTGLSPGPRLGEAGIQRQRVGTRTAQEARPSVFPRGVGGLDILGQLIGAMPGGAAGMPSGQQVR